MGCLENIWNWIRDVFITVGRKKCCPTKVGTFPVVGRASSRRRIQWFRILPNGRNLLAHQARLMECGMSSPRIIANCAYHAAKRGIADNRALRLKIMSTLRSARLNRRARMMRVDPDFAHPRQTTSASWRND